MADSTALKELALIKELLSELTERVSSLGEALSPSITDQPTQEVSVPELSQADKDFQFNELVWEYKDLTLRSLQQRAKDAGFDEAQVMSAPVDKLRRNLFKEETGNDWPEESVKRETYDDKLVSEKDLGFANLPQLRKFAVEVRGKTLSEIQALTQEELYQLLKADDKQTADVYTAEELKATPRPRLASIARSLGLQLVPDTKKDEYITEILNKQEETINKEK